MFQYGLDECATNAPPWYAPIDKAIEKENFDEAARLAREPLLSAQNEGDVPGQGIALNAYIKVLIAKNDPWNGRKYGQIAMDVAATSKSKNQEAMAAHIAAKVELKDRKVADAKRLAETAKKLYAAANNAKGEASTLITMAKAHIMKKESEEALKCLSTAFDSLKAIGDDRGIIAALYATYELKMKEDLVYPALQTMEEISEKLKDIGDVAGQGAAEFVSAEVYFSQGNLSDAMRCAGLAAELFDMVGDAKKKGAAVFIMASTFRTGGQMEDAEEAAAVALQCFKAGRQKQGQAGALVMLGQLFVAKGGASLPDAAYKFEEACFLYRQLKDNKSEAETLGQLCAVQLTILESGGKMKVQEPIRHGRRAAILFEDGNLMNTPSNAKLQMVLAKALLEEKEDLDEAAASIEASMNAYSEISDRLGEAQATEIAAKIQFAAKDKDKGVELAQKAADIYHEVGDGAGAVAAEALVESRGKPKAGAVRQLSWIDIHWGPKMYAQLTEFEARAARYSASSMAGGGGEGASSSASFDTSAPGAKKSASGKVQYAIRWQRVTHIDMLKQGSN
mmetsp:Transcript_140508/g.262037  ORF Transcript_140508/g.262037 Transcript_140508/m.262037 type:complete len:564 (-) Transcript_140508:28-1719(-)